MAHRTPLLAAVVAVLAPRASARCDYRVGGKCCTGANSHGAPGLDLLTSRVTVSKESTTSTRGRADFAGTRGVVLARLFRPRAPRRAGRGARGVPDSAPAAANIAGADGGWT